MSQIFLVTTDWFWMYQNIMVGFFLFFFYFSLSFSSVLQFSLAFGLFQQRKRKGEWMRDTGREENKTLIYITCLFQFSLLVYQWPACDSPSQLWDGGCHLQPTYCLSHSNCLWNNIYIWTVRIYSPQIFTQYSVKQSHISTDRSPLFFHYFFFLFFFCLLNCIIRSFVSFSWCSMITVESWSLRCWGKLLIQWF